MDEKAIEKSIKDIRELKIQGAKAVAVAGVEILKKVYEEYGFGEQFDDMCERLESTRPTAVPLHNAIEMIRRKRNEDVFEEIFAFFDDAKERIAAHASRLINEGGTYMTHCHSSEVLAAFKFAKRQGKYFRVIVTETRPKLQGLKTAKELAGVDIPVTYIVDGAAAGFMDGTTAVIMGVDAIRKNGVYNKIGSHMIALAAKERGIPVYFLGDTLKIDRRPQIKIEERPAGEIVDLRTLRGVEVKNPAFDMTPWNLIDAVITEIGEY